MLWTDLTKRALIKSAQLHDGQYRKGGEGLYPYILHPIEVAALVSKYSNDEEVVAAALLHDTLEDTDYSVDTMTEEFGARIAQIVESVSIPEAGIKNTWFADRTAYIQRLAGSTSEGATIAAADKIHNFRSILNHYASDPSQFVLHFKGSVEDRRAVYGAVVESLKDKIPTGLQEELLAAWSAYTVFLEATEKVAA